MKALVIIAGALLLVGCSSDAGNYMPTKDSLDGICMPACGGSECGANGCGGTCGQCQAGHYCKQGQCLEGPCQTNCVGKECGDDGCGGECGICPSGMSCSGTKCLALECVGVAVSFAGQFNNSVSPLSFDSVTVEVRHKRDVDQWEDGCITYLKFIFQKGTGCTLQVTAGQAFDPTGLLHINEISFKADSQCPGFPDDVEGMYFQAGDWDVAGIELIALEVPGYNVAESCVHTSFDIHLEGQLQSSEAGKSLKVLPTVLSVTGDFDSEGSESDSCPCESSCEGKECGDAGCGFSCGQCGCGEDCVGGICAFENCDTKECGDDGCGGSCGQCGCGEQCVDGACLSHACDGKECGDDGCGGICGSCGCGEECVAAKCSFTACNDKQCGNDACGGSCGSCDGENTKCESGQCVCDGFGCADKCCAPGEVCGPGSTCCLPDCAGKQCGPDGCSGLCGECPGDSMSCELGHCVCQPDCVGKDCGTDGCGGECGKCLGPLQECVNGHCSCQPTCAGAMCGPDGCGGSCGQCNGVQESCVNGQCTCQPACAAKDCGPDGCGGVCGACVGPQTVCKDGQCVCTPNCSNKECGSDGCGAGCGQCECGEVCVGGECVFGACSGKECGADGCGGTCGICLPQEICVVGSCVCFPQCAGKKCGDDGCGGECGECAQGTCNQQYGICVETGFVLVPNGSYSMGSPASEGCREADEGPQHSVTVSHAMVVSKYEVTQEQWTTVTGTPNPSYFGPSGPSKKCVTTSLCPVERVDWFEAVKYCNLLSSKRGLEECYVLSGCSGTLGGGCGSSGGCDGNTYQCQNVSFKGIDCPGYRLPTEAEWEYLARAGEITQIYNGELSGCDCAGGPALDKIAWYCGNSARTHWVGGKKSNGWGLFDMSGNVWEWCHDWGQPNYYANGQSLDPLGGSGTERVTRGGSWLHNSKYCRSAERYYVNPIHRGHSFGFRVLRTLVQ